MKTEKMTYEEYWEEVRKLFGYKDTITMVVDDEYREIIEFRNSVGCLLSTFNIDTEEVTYY